MQIKFKRQLIFITILITACSTLQKFQPLQTDLTIVQQKFPDTAFPDLQNGYKLYKKNCSGCHALHYPNQYYAAQWDTILPKMYSKAKITNDTEQLHIKQYLYSKAKYK